MLPKPNSDPYQAPLLLSLHSFSRVLMEKRTRIKNKRTNFILYLTEDMICPRSSLSSLLKLELGLKICGLKSSVITAVSTISCAPPAYF